MKLRVVLKYCGGCNPEYDRVEIANHLQQSLQDKIKIVPPESENVDLILAVHGCRTACADLKPFQGLKINTITSIEDSYKFIRTIRGGGFPEDAPLHLPSYSFVPCAVVLYQVGLKLYAC